jgi:hypothetical protein
MEHYFPNVYRFPCIYLENVIFAKRGFFLLKNVLDKISSGYNFILIVLLENVTVQLKCNSKKNLTGGVKTTS